ncbi:hypothetical protein [Streptomyces sp. NRRL F-2664]|uniref:hypothetical protein n=1 Tax=Streptomyces sp. NRRL F-2664 TaxID=1463842 RepID=UPI00131E6D05|nr:hypothetical protein [Streptomyces sp. NRRL F-2664]
MDFLVPVQRVLLELAVRWHHDAAAGLSARALIAGVSEDLHGRPSARVSDRAWLTGVVMSAQPADWQAGLQDMSPAGVGEDHGLDRVLHVLAGGELLTVPAAGRGPADRDPGVVDDPGLSPGIEVVDRHRRNP